MPIERTIAVARRGRSPRMETQWCYLFGELHIRERICITRYAGDEDGTRYAWTSWNWPLRWREVLRREEMWCGRGVLTPR